METPSFEVFCSDGQLLGEPISKAWATFYAAMDGLVLDHEGEQIFCQCTGRDRYTPRIHPEATGICGRRSEKTSTALKYLLWKALYAGWEKQLRRSWFSRVARSTRLLRIPLISQDLRISRDTQRSLESYVLGSKAIANEVEEILRTEVILANGVAFICLPASKASTRGMTCPGGLVDELAWVQIEGADDKELLRQLRPGMITFAQQRRLIKLSTPWLRSGVLYDEFQSRGERLDPLVWCAATTTMSPRISLEELERERAADESYYRREYLAQFVDDLECFIPPADITAAIASWKELPPQKDTFYVACADASGLSGGDRFTFTVGHSDNTGSKVDLLRGWRREPAAQVLDEIAGLCQSYRIHNLTADQWSHTFLAELFRQREIALEQLTFSARSKPEVFFDLKNALAQGRFQLPNHPEAIRELRALESLRTSGGGYKIGAPRGQTDDYVTVLALLANKIKRSVSREPWVLTLKDGVFSDEESNSQSDFDPFNDAGFRSRSRGPSFGRR